MKLGLGIGFYLATGAIAPTPPAYDYLVTSDAELATVLANDDATLSGKTIAFADGSYTSINLSGRTFTSYLVFKSLNPVTPYGGGATLGLVSIVNCEKVWVEDFDVHRTFTIGVSSPSSSHIFFDGNTDCVVTGNYVYGDEYPGSSAYDYATSNQNEWESDTDMWYRYRWPKAQFNFRGLGTTTNENIGCWVTGNKFEFVYSGIRGKFKDSSIVAKNLVTHFYNTGVQNSGGPIQDYTESWNVVTKGIANVGDNGNNNAFDANWAEEKTDSADGFNEKWTFALSGSQWASGITFYAYGKIRTDGTRSARVRLVFNDGGATTFESSATTSTSYVTFDFSGTIPAGATSVDLGIYNETGSGQAWMTQPFLGSIAYGPHSSAFAFTPVTKTVDYDNIVKEGNVCYGHFLRADHSGMKLDDLTGAGRYTNCKFIGNLLEGNANINMEICNPYQCTIENNTMFSLKTGNTLGIKFTDEAHSLSAASYTGNRCANNVVGLNTIIGSGDFEVTQVNNIVVTVASGYAAAFDGPVTADTIVTNPFTQFAPKSGGVIATSKPISGAVGSIVSWPVNFLTAPTEGTITDNQPDAPGINDTVNAPVSSTITSNTATLVGFDVATTIAPVTSGLSIQKNAGSFLTSSQSFSASDTVTLRMTSSGTDDDVQPQNWTVGGLTYTWTVTNEGTYTQVDADFNGTDSSYLHSGGIIPKGPTFTFSAWFKFDTFNACRILDLGGRCYILILRTGFVTVNLQRFNSVGIFTGATQAYSVDVGLTDDGLKHHIMLRVNNNSGSQEVLLYIDGTEYDIGTAAGFESGNDGDLYINATTQAIGSRYDGQQKLDGTLSDAWLDTTLRPLSDFYDAGDPVNLGGYATPYVKVITASHWTTGTHGGTAAAFTSANITAA